MGRKSFALPYIVWMVGFTIIPLAMIVFYGLTDRTGAFTLNNVAQIMTAEHAQALWLSIGLSVVSTLITGPVVSVSAGNGFEGYQP